MGKVKNELGDNYVAPFSYFFYLRQRWLLKRFIGKIVIRNPDFLPGIEPKDPLMQDRDASLFPFQLVFINEVSDVFCKRKYYYMFVEINIFFWLLIIS